MTWREVHEKFLDKNHIALYGGGPKSKGHGFWINPASPEIVKRYRETAGWLDLSDCAPALQNDGKRSGNPYFWMFSDAVALLNSL